MKLKFVDVEVVVMLLIMELVVMVVVVEMINGSVASSGPEEVECTCFNENGSVNPLCQ